MPLLKGKKFLVAGLILALPIFAWAGDPVGFSLTPSAGLPTTTSVGSSYSVHYTITNNLPFNEPIKPTAHSNSGIGFTVTDNCGGKTLAANGGTCNVEVVFQPVQAGAASLQLSLHYDRNVVPLPVLSTTVQSSSTTEISGTVTKTLPANTTVNTGYDAEFTFNNIGSTSVTASSVTVTGDSSNFSVSTNTCTAALGASRSCTVSGTYTPTSAGEKTLGVTYAYQSGTKSVSLETRTVASSGSGGCASVSGSTSLLLPTATYIYADNVVKLKFTNQCDSASATMGTVSLSGTYSGSSSMQAQKKKHAKLLSSSATSWITKGTDTCSGQTLAANSSCEVTASVVPVATGSNLEIQASIPYTQSSQSLTATASTVSNSILANDNTNRMITIVNQCSVPIWMTFAAAAIPNSPSCTTNSDCPSYASCNNTVCYFNNPSLDGNHTFGKMAAAVAGKAPDTMNVSISEDNAGTSPTNNILYNAGIAARLGCTATGVSTNPLFCTVNNCGNTANPASGSTDANGMCKPGTGPSNSPGMTYNAVEFTFLRNFKTRDQTVDGIYDEQTINGINVPMEMKGRGPFTSGSVPYQNCQPAGALIQQTTGSSATQLGSCNYSYTTPTGFRASNYRFVTFESGAIDCTSSDSLCTAESGTVCGLAYRTDTNKITKRCGTIAGHVSVNTGICSQDPSIFEGSLGTDLQTEYNCNTSYTYSTGKQLYACSGTYAGQSCYNPDTSLPAASCCGCVDWWTSNGGSLSVPTSTTSCGTTYINPNWASPTGIVQPQIQWVKQACPTAYAYQYDDVSSGFSCTVTTNGSGADGNIVTNYQVTFCPGGKEVSTITP
jgi:hypothetical protein